MKKSKWLDKFENGTSLQENPNNSVVKLPPNYVGLGYDTSSRKFSPAWGGQFQEGGKLNPLSPMQQVQQAVQPTPTVPYLQTKDPSEFYKSWIQSPEYERRQLLTGYSEGEDLYMPNAADSRESRLGAIEQMTPITYNTRQPSEAKPGVYGSPSYVNINPSDYVGTSKEAIQAHELAHVAGAMGEVRPGMMSGKEQEIFKKSMLPMKEPVLSGVQGSKEREASVRALEDFKHSQEPDEAKADLDALRFMMYDKGIYDITKGKKFTETDFQKSKQNLGNDRVFKRLENRMGKKNFVNLMNTIASTDTQEELPIAMGGMSIPGSVGFSYARVAGAAPSKGKYAKKTMASAQNGIMSPMLLARNVLNYFYPSKEATPALEAAPVNYEKGLTNELLQRQAYKESTFNPAAVSPAGYKGLTQIGEGVLKDYSNKRGGKKLDPFNPEDAVELQKFAMDDLYNASFINKPNQSDSVRIAKTLAAYNWGRGNLSNYLNEQKSKGVDIYDSYDWLNNLPKETSDYVNKILLQEDPSFNKNYKKASTNPKYEEVTSLYDQKRFGGDIPSAQNGKKTLQDATRVDNNASDKFWGIQREVDSQNLNDDSFREKYGMPLHQFKMRDSNYASAFNRQMDVIRQNDPNYSELNLPKTDIRRRDVITPNQQFMAPSNLTGEARKQFVEFNENVIGSALPVPGLEVLGKIPSVFGLGKTAVQQAGKLLKVEDPLEAAYKISSENLSPAPLTQTPTSWSMQEAPGLHLKSTMSDGAVSKIVEPKTGLINIEQALAIIGKESGGPDKVALIKQGIGENIPKKMDYNEFRKTVQDQLIPLERQFATGRSDYGLDSIGYYGKPFFDEYNNVYRVVGAKDLSFKTQEEAMSFAGKNNPLENQTLILGNKGRFGRGSSAHNNPDETLGHIHFLRDAETPDVLTVTQIQSDAFQGTHRNMPKSIEDATQKLNKTKSDSDYVLESFGEEGDKERFKDLFDNVDKYLQLDQASLENFTQKSLLDKNHQERYLQELVNYAGERGDINKLRLPTSDTAAKVQGYYKMTSNELDWISEGQKVKFKDGEGVINDDMIWSDSIDIKLPNGKSKLVSIKELESYNKELIEKIKPEVTYSASDETILKKYAEQPKTIKKLFGVEPKIVKDAKGNSWYEFDIPKSFKEGKGEIKAFENGGKLTTAQNGQEMRFYQNGLDWKPRSMQPGGNIERVSVNDPRYPELYKNRQVGAYYDGAYSLPDLDEVTITAPRSYTMDSLRDFTTAALYGAPATAMKLEAIPQAAMTETIEMLRGRPYDFSNVNPNIGSFSSNQRDLSQTLGYENPEGFLQNAVNLGLSAIDPVIVSGASKVAGKQLGKKAVKAVDLDDVAKRKIHLQKLKDEKLIHPDTDINKYSKSLSDTEQLTKKALTQRETYYRGVTPKIPEGPEQQLIIEEMTKAGVDISNPEEVGRYMATHVPLQKLDYNAGFQTSNPSHNALYTSGGFSRYGDMTFEMSRPLDFSKGSYSNWLDDLYKYPVYNPSEKIDDLSPFTRAYALENRPGPGVFVGTKGQKIFDDARLVTDDYGRIKSRPLPGLEDAGTINQQGSGSFLQGLINSRMIQNYNPLNLKTNSALDWSKKWYADPITIERRRRTIPEYNQEDKALSLLDQYEPKNYFDLLKEQGLREYVEKSLTTAGVSYGKPNQIYVNRSRFIPFNRQRLESVRTHELSHLINDNDYDLTSGERADLVKPFGFIDNSDRIEQLQFSPTTLTNKEIENISRYTEPGEIKARMDQVRFDLDLTPSDKFTSGMFDKILKKNNFYGMGDYIKDKKAFIDLMNNFWAAPAVGVAVGAQAVDQQKNGGITKDNQGYWNPDNWGKPVEIDSNDITMEGVYEPLLGVSDTGDTKLMKPGKNYKFKGKKVTEFPVAKDGAWLDNYREGGSVGINQLDAQPMKKLNQLLNFTNNPDKDNWLDKYN